MSYDTIPGTLAHRALAFLRTLPNGTWIDSTLLAESIGSSRSHYMGPSLVTAVKHGLILREKRAGNVYWQAAAPGAVRAVVASDRDEWPRQADALDIDAIHRLSAQNNPFSGVVPNEAPDPAASESDPARLSDGIDDDTKWGAPALPPAADPAPANQPDAIADDSSSRLVSNPEPAAPTVDLDQDEPFRFSWCSDGRITVIKAGATVVMEPNEYATLARFIGVIRGFQP